MKNGGDTTILQIPLSDIKPRDDQPKLKKAGPYLVDPAKNVVSGPYQGEKVSSCDKNSGTMRIDGVLLKPWQARRFRERHNLGPGQFHLDDQSQKPGAYCLAFENPSTNANIIEGFSCHDFGQWEARRYWDAAIPWYGGSTCYRVRREIQRFVSPTPPGPVANAIHGILNGAYFGIGMFAADRAINASTGTSFLGRLFSGLGKAFGNGVAPVLHLIPECFLNGINGCRPRPGA